jgi:hypothetical protein
LAGPVDPFALRLVGRERVSKVEMVYVAAPLIGRRNLLSCGDCRAEEGDEDKGPKHSS